jgi:regulator of protease activity HflC (stomatin/prohibitin superfamily)
MVTQMMEKATVRVRRHERGLLFVHGDFARVLQPGVYRFWERLLSQERARVDVVSVLTPRLEHPLLDVLLEDPMLREQVSVFDLSQTQRALIWVDERLHAVHGPGKYVYWNSPPAPAKVRVEVLNADTLRFEHPRRDAVVEHSQAGVWFDSVDVPSESAVLVYRSGDLEGRLPSGRNVLFRGQGKLSYKSVDLREKTAEVAGQEIMTGDKVSLRVTLVVSYQVVDAVKSVTVAADADQALYREAQLALRVAVGSRTLDQLLADKNAVGGEVQSALSSRTGEFGVQVRSVGLRDVILPGEMKMILNQVIEAEKRAQAELIRRREETAAARSQANTARILAENPGLGRLRELELLKEVLAGTNATFVFAQGDLADQVRALVTSTNKS